MQFSSIEHIDSALSGGTIPGQSRPVSNGNEECSAFSKAPVSLEPHY